MNGKPYISRYSIQQSREAQAARIERIEKLRELNNDYLNRQVANYVPRAYNNYGKAETDTRRRMHAADLAAERRWNKHIQKQKEYELKMIQDQNRFLPPPPPVFYGPHRQTHTYVDEDGYTVYSEVPLWKINRQRAIDRLKAKNVRPGWYNRLVAIQKLKARGYKPGWYRQYYNRRTTI